MCNQNEWIVREAFIAYNRGDIPRMMDFVHQDLEWTYLDPAFPDPSPQTCHGRDQLEKALLGYGERGLRTEVEQVVASGDKVIVVTRTPGLDRYRQRQADDRNFDVLTVRDGLIVAVHACHDRAEAQALAGID
jgi:ketosteroid isomerase-like protein